MKTIPAQQMDLASDSRSDTVPSSQREPYFSRHTITTQRKTHVVLTSLLALVISALLSGCGGGTTVTSKNERSVGQQLTDLSNARLQGIISEKEYEKLKRAIIRDND